MPWKLSDVISLVTSLVIGATALVAGWIGISGEPRHSEQTAWLNLGLAGLVITGVGIAVWLLAGRRAIGQRRAVLLPDVAADVAGLAVEAERATTIVVLPGMTRYHRDDCELVAGKPARAVGSRRRSLQPCAVCQPEGA